MCRQSFAALLDVLGDGPVKVEPFTPLPGRRFAARRLSSLVSTPDERLEECAQGGVGFECGGKWGLSYSPPADFEGAEMEAMLALNVVLSHREDAEYDEDDTSVGIADLVRRVIASLDASGACYYAIADCNAVIKGGSYYTPVPVRPLRWRQDVERFEWLSFGVQGRQRRVRDVYWGQYLGPELASRFAPQEAFCTAFNSLVSVRGWNGAPGIRGTQQAHVFPSGSMFLSISADPLDIVRVESNFDAPDIPEIHNAVWLKREFRCRGLI